MTTKIQRWGNSQGLRIPKDLLKEAGITIGEEVVISVEEGVLTVTPVSRSRGKYKLEELVRGIPEDYKPHEAEWGDPAGKEVW
ncbi:MAG TPA: AbrB/MazE/SpoVT family DNA-binding domain-containing protein [Rhodothermales bacterium]|nr:AbrB/MazE/SpoVT family DNA-binding domain-containing protein [Rhodothermales bacterium]